MNGRWRVAAVMGCMWVASLLYGEVFIYRLPLWTCPWPSLVSFFLTSCVSGFWKCTQKIKKQNKKKETLISDAWLW